jgi:spore coat protein CotH
VHQSSRRTTSRWRRSAVAALATVALLAGCSASAADSDADSDAGATADGLYDDSVVHDIEVTVEPDDYAELVAAYQESSEKVWIEATVVIDGVTYEQVGLRLKGNSSLFSLSGRGGAGGAPIDITDACVVDTTQATTATTATTVAAADDTTDEVADDDLTNDPESLPWLIRLDKFIDDQSHEGVTELVVRSNNSETAINEAVALELLAEAGLATQEATAVRFTFNGSDAELRLVIEHPEDEWVATQFDEESSEAIGQLYKAESTGDWGYHGDDPAEYEEVWDQEAGEDDLTPLTDFLQFINESTDEEFAAELADRLDVEAFARYLAFEDLVGNFDDIAGPGNNSYLYFDPDTGQATVVAWDHNLAFSGGMGGVPGGGGQGQMPPGGIPAGGPGGVPMELPEGCELPDFQPGELPDFDPDNPPTGGPGGGAGGGMNRSNILVDRFNSVPEFAALYDAAVVELTETLFTDGTADEIVQRWVTVLTEQAGDLVSAEAVEADAETVRAAFPAG